MSGLCPPGQSPRQRVGIVGLGECLTQPRQMLLVQIYLVHEAFECGQRSRLVAVAHHLGDEERFGGLGIRDLEGADEGVGRRVLLALLTVQGGLQTEQLHGAPQVAEMGQQRGMAFGEVERISATLVNRRLLE